MIFGYARVSTKDQNLDRQTRAIEEYCQKNNLKLDRMFSDKITGKEFNRMQYQGLKLCLRKGDLLIIKELDRIGRSMKQVKNEWHEFQEIGIDIIVIDTPILNTNNKSTLEKELISNIVFEILSYISEKELNKMKQRQAEGIALAREKGKHLGRPKIEKPKQWDEIYTLWKSNKISAVEAARLLKLTKSTFYRFVKSEKEEQKINYKTP